MVGNEFVIPDGRSRAYFHDLWETVTAQSPINCENTTLIDGRYQIDAMKMSSLMEHLDAEPEALSDRQKLRQRTMAHLLLFSVVGYMACSSTMLVVNKAAVQALDAPATVLMLQVLVSASTVMVLGMARIVPVDALEWRKLSQYFVAALGFLFAMYANMKTLQHCNIETFIICERGPLPEHLRFSEWNEKYWNLSQFGRAPL